MPIILNISDEKEATLRQSWGDGLDRAALEALVIEGYREGKLGIGQVRRLLDLETRFDAEAWLAQHQVPMNYTMNDLRADRQTLRDILGSGEA